MPTENKSWPTEEDNKKGHWEVYDRMKKRIVPNSRRAVKADARKVRDLCNITYLGHAEQLRAHKQRAKMGQTVEFRYVVTKSSLHPKVQKLLLEGL